MSQRLSSEDRAVLRRFTIVMVAAYPVFVLAAAVTHIFDQRLVAALMYLVTDRILPEQPPMPWWQRLQADWPELLYGPAIALICCWAIVTGGMLWSARRRLGHR